MAINSAKFVKGVVGPDKILNDGKDQVAFIGRSNVGKSSVINVLTKQPGLAKTSATPGHTTEINVFLINKSMYLIDLPGYGFVQGSKKDRERLQGLIYWYLFNPANSQRKVFVIIDASVGLTQSDTEILFLLVEKRKDIVIVANKIDKLKSSHVENQIQKINETVKVHKVIPFSAKTKFGLGELTREVLE